MRYSESMAMLFDLDIIIYKIYIINASIVQSSVVGPPSYAIVASDLRARHSESRMAKVVGNTYVLVGSAMVHNNIPANFNNIQS